MLFFFFLNHAWYAYLALFHVETNYTVCYVTALWTYFIHHWMWGLVFSFPIYKSNEKPPLSGMQGQNGGGLGGKSQCRTFLFQITRQWSEWIVLCTHDNTSHRNNFTNSSAPSVSSKPLDSQDSGLSSFPELNMRSPKTLKVCLCSKLLSCSWESTEAHT